MSGKRALEGLSGFAPSGAAVACDVPAHAWEALDLEITIARSLKDRIPGHLLPVDRYGRVEVLALPSHYHAGDHT